jgi:tetratricopeptide (TPR) repeat protein
MLAVASVIGSEFGVACLEQACGTTAEHLMDALGPALAHEIIAGARGAPGVYRFSHALIREALYEELSPAERVRLHRRIGEALETIYRADPEPHLVELAHHFLQARPGGDTSKGVDYAVRAARRAAAGLAYDEAAVLYARALGARESTAVADERQRCELLLALGEVQWRTGGGCDLRQTFRQAADIARRVGDPVLLARSALGLAGESSGRLWVESGAVDQSLVSLLEEALDAVGDRDSTVRARLLACLAVQLYYSFPSRERSVRLSEQAVALARAAGDLRVLVAALRARCVALWRLEDREERLALATEMVFLADQTGDREQALPGRRFRVIGFLEQGDIAAVDHEIEACSRIASELRQPFLLSYVARWRAMRALLEGRFGDAEREAGLSFELAERARDAGDALIGLTIQVAVIRMYQGRLDEAERAMRSAETHPRAGRLPRCFLAQISCEQGRLAEARRELAALSVWFIPAYGAEAGWLYVTCMLSLVCAGVGDAESAEVLYRLLLPHASRVGVLGPGVCCWGSVSHALGELAATLGHGEDATKHFDEALRMHERMGALPLVASTAYAYGRVLLRDDAPADREQARELLDRAFAAAHELGMESLVLKIRALRADAPPGPVRQPAALCVPPEGGASGDESVFRREGDFWTIAYGGRVVRVKDAKGLRDIAAAPRPSRQGYPRGRPDRGLRRLAAGCGARLLP